RLPPGPDRPRLRGRRVRGQQPGRPVLRGPQDDAADGRGDGPAGRAAQLEVPQEGEEGQGRPGTDAAEGARRDARAPARRARPAAARHDDAGPVQAQPAQGPPALAGRLCRRTVARVTTARVVRGWTGTTRCRATPPAWKAPASTANGHP